MGLTLYLTVLTIIEIFLYLFHLSLLILLISKRKKAFSGPFYSILRIVLVADLCAYLGLCVQNKISQIPSLQPFLKSADAIAYLLYTDFSCSSLVQFFGHALMAFNRFTMLWFPLSQNKIWKNQWYIFLLLGLALLHYLWKCNQQIRFVFYADESVVTAMVDSYYSGLYYTIQTTIYISTTALAAIFSGLAFLKFQCHKQASKNIHGNEKSLLFVSLIIFVAQLFRCIYVVIKLFTADPGVVAVLAVILPLLYDILAWSGSLSLVFLSSTTRQHYIRFYLRRKNLKVVFVTSTQTGVHK